MIGGSGDGGYIYWQKGKYFANATDIDIDNVYFKVNIMRCYGSDELEGKKVAQHIAQSIKKNAENKEINLGFLFLVCLSAFMALVSHSRSWR